MSQHKQSLRKSMQSALSHKRLANELLDSLADLQAKFNAAMDKADADADGTLDTDYEASHAIIDVFEADGDGSGAQHGQSLRKSLRSALAHRRLADEIADAMEEIHVAFNAMLVKLDAEGGTLDDGDYEDTLAVEVLDPELPLSSAQHKRSVRESMRSAMAHRRLADTLLDQIKAAQESLNGALAQLDAGSINGAMAAFKVTPVDPDGV